MKEIHFHLNEYNEASQLIGHRRVNVSFKNLENKAASGISAEIGPIHSSFVGMWFVIFGLGKELFRFEVTKDLVDASVNDLTIKP